MGMRTRDLRKPRLRYSVGVMIVGAVVALAGCAAQPAKTQGGTTAGAAPSAEPVASKPIDFHTLSETKCPSTAPDTPASTCSAITSAPTSIGAPLRRMSGACARGSSRAANGMMPRQR